MKWQLGVLLWILTGLLAGCGPQENNPPPSPAADPSSAASTESSSAGQSAVRQLVTRFGEQMRNVSTLAPPDMLRPQLGKVYGDLVTPDLLQQWQNDPSRAVGREVSSPWPAGIDIKHLYCSTASKCHVQGTVRYMTSNETEHGGVAARRPIDLQLKRIEGGHWRISGVDVGNP